MKSALLILVGAMIMNAQSPFDGLVDRYFDDQFRLHPSRATAFGLRDPFDSQAEDYSGKGIQEQIAVDQQYLAEFAGHSTASSILLMRGKSLLFLPQ